MIEKMNKRPAILVVCLLLTLANVAWGAASWEVRLSTADDILNDVAFTSALTGWAVGNGGALLRSTDRGRTWTAEASGTAQDLNALKFASATSGYAVGAARTVVSYNGTNWTAAQVPHAVDIDLYDVQLTGTATILAFGGAGYSGGTSNYRNFFRSRDGGVSWESYNIRNTAEATTVRNYLYAASFLGNGTGWAVGINSAATPAGKIFKTTDGGETWADITPAAMENIIFRDVYFWDANNGWIAGGDQVSGAGYIYYTDNGGTTWTSQHTATPGLFASLTGTATTDLWSVSRTKFYNFDGTNWVETASGLAAGAFTAVNFSDPWNGWVVGGRPTADGALRYVYKYVVEPYALASDRVLYISAVTQESAVIAFSGANIQSNAALTLEAVAGVPLVTYEVVYDPTVGKHKIDARVRVDQATALTGTYNFYVNNPDEGTAGSGTFVLRASATPTERPVADTVPAGVFDPATTTSLDMNVKTLGPVSGSGVRTSSVPADVPLELVVYRIDTRTIAYRKQFNADPSGYTTLTLQKVTDLGLEVADGIYNAVVLHPQYGKIGSGVIVVHRTR
ncbi:MAG: YCF48-related protein [Candidatus Margulisbacteria bacterium]|jgi:photosystem II stability/assembly factor-like uncharacterized protein|nr:YCF48-related protein [Candidatus Margulisiibacteriota bacterium]